MLLGIVHIHVHVAECSSVSQGDNECHQDPIKTIRATVKHPRYVQRLHILIAYIVTSEAHSTYIHVHSIQKSEIFPGA